MRQAGRYLPEYREIRQSCNGFLDLCYTPAKATEVTLQPLRRFDLDAAILFSDILVIPDALGCEVAFKTNEGPVLSTIRSEEDINTLSLDGVIDHLSPVLETVDRLKGALPKDKALIGFAGSPWTVATYMVEGRGSKDYFHTKQCAYQTPELFQNIIEIITEATILYLDAQIQAGADVIQLFDSWANILPESLFKRWCIEPNARIVKALKARHPSIPIIGFPRAVGLHYVPYVEQTQVDAVSVDSHIPLSWVASELQSKCVVQGNLDPVLLASNKEHMLEEAERILSVLAGKPFIFNLGHGIVPSTPIDHVEALVSYVKQWNKTTLSNVG